MSPWGGQQRTKDGQLCPGSHREARQSQGKDQSEHPQDQAAEPNSVRTGQEAVFCSNAGFSLACRLGAVKALSTKGSLKQGQMPHTPSCEDGGHVPSSRGPHWLAQGGRVEKILVGARGAWVMAGVPQA